MKKNQTTTIAEIQQFVLINNLSRGFLARIFDFLYKNKLVALYVLEMWTQKNGTLAKDQEIKNWWDNLPKNQIDQVETKIF